MIKCIFLLKFKTDVHPKSDIVLICNSMIEFESSWVIRVIFVFNCYQFIKIISFLKQSFAILVKKKVY